MPRSRVPVGYRQSNSHFITQVTGDGPMTDLRRGSRHLDSGHAGQRSTLDDASPERLIGINRRVADGDAAKPDRRQPWEEGEKTHLSMDCPQPNPPFALESLRPLPASRGEQPLLFWRVLDGRVK